ncbi:hypothetical protein EI533_04870 [Pseudomonas donghuensis]|nr:hypothetical protein [Pseudomonas donghuensis]
MPAIGREAVVIQAPPDVLAVPASSLVSQLRTPDLWELALPAIERAAVVIQAPPDVLAVLASSRAKREARRRL